MRGIMEIYINNNKIDFVLEDEKNVYEIVNCIADSCANESPQQFLITILVDDKEYSFADEENLRRITLDAVSKIEIETTDIFGITLLSLGQMEKFMKLLDNVIDSANWDISFKKIFESMDWMKDGIEHITSIFGNQNSGLLSAKSNFISAYQKLSEIFSNFQKDSFPLKPDVRSYALGLKKTMADNLLMIKNTLSESGKFFDRDLIANNIDKLINEIDDILPRLSNVPLLFQTGQDRESMDTIQKLAVILENSISLFVIFKENFKLYLDKYTVKEVSFEVFFNTLTDHLKELMNSIENKDFVMIGDLLEYEFVPNIEEIKSILTKIKNEAFIKAN